MSLTKVSYAMIQGNPINVLDYGADPSGSADSTTAIQNAINSGASDIYVPEGTYLVSNIQIKNTVQKFTGAGASSVGTYFTHKTGSTGSVFSWDGTNRITFLFMGFFRIDCNSGATETYGLDLSGFSYCTFENIWVRLAYLDGVYADGSVTPTNKQFSNNSFINVRSNNNLRDGWRFIGALGNSANTYVGCEGSGNASIGFNETVGYSNQTVGCTFQGNTGHDFYTNGTQNVHSFYSEGNPQPVYLDTASKANVFSVRSSYPLWNTFIDNGAYNKVSTRYESTPEQFIFNNPYFLSWTGITPDNITQYGTWTLSSFADSTSIVGASLQAVSPATGIPGFIFTLNATNTSVQGKYVTLLIEVDTSGITDTLQTRVYARDGTTGNSVNGTFVQQTLPITTSGVYKTLAYDVKFADTISGTPNIIWYVGYSGITTNNTLKIRSVQILMGSTSNSSNWLGVQPDLNTTTTILSAKANGINIHLKSIGKTVANTTNGKLYFATGTTDVSPWRATDGSGDITPV
jgi:hypothetical protein